MNELRLRLRWFGQLLMFYGCKNNLWMVIGVCVNCGVFVLV